MAGTYRRGLEAGTKGFCTENTKYVFLKIEKMSPSIIRDNHFSGVESSLKCEATS